MLRLDLVGPFTAGNLAQESGADPATIRQNLARDRERGLIIQSETTMNADGRIRPVRLTPEGRRQLTEEADAAYAILRQEVANQVAEQPSNQELPPGVLAFETAMETLASLAPVDHGIAGQPCPAETPRILLARLRLAAVELAAAVRAGISVAAEVAKVIEETVSAVQMLNSDDDVIELRDAFLRKVEELRAVVFKPDLLDQLVSMLPELRAEARAITPVAQDAAAVLQRAVAQVLHNGIGIVIDLRGSVSAALRRQISITDMQQLPIGYEVSHQGAIDQLFNNISKHIDNATASINNKIGEVSLGVKNSVNPKSNNEMINSTRHLPEHNGYAHAQSKVLQ